MMWECGWMNGMNFVGIEMCVVVAIVWGRVCKKTDCLVLNTYFFTTSAISSFYSRIFHFIFASNHFAFFNVARMTVRQPLV